jgi:hypothetical protein
MVAHLVDSPVRRLRHQPTTVVQISGPASQLHIGVPIYTASSPKLIGAVSKEGTTMKKFRIYQACTTLAAIATVAIASGAGLKF